MAVRDIVTRHAKAGRRTSSLRSDGRPGAIVIGGDYLGLGIVRSLGRRGIRVCVMDDERSIARFSRYTRYWVPVRDLRDGDGTADELLKIAQRLQQSGWVVFPTRDETVTALAQHRLELEGTFRITTPDWGVIQWTSDKRNTYKLASRLGIPTPRTWYPRKREDLADVDTGPPWVIKPAIKEHFIYATKAKAWQADNRSQLAQLFDRAMAVVGPGEVMIQEKVPGGGMNQFSYCAMFRDGMSVAAMTALRRRQHPPEFGRASTYVQTIDVPLLEDLSTTFLREIGYRGLVEMEYKRDPRNGVFKLLDVNARAWGYHTLGRAAGVDFPYAAYADQIGAPIEPGTTRAGVHWMRLATDVPTALLQIGRGTLSGREYLRSLSDVSVEAVFEREDPMPALREIALLPYLAAKRGY